MIPFVIEICWDEIKDVKVKDGLKDGKGTKGTMVAAFALSLVIVFMYCLLPRAIVQASRKCVPRYWSAVARR